MFTVGCCQGLPSEAVVREALRTLCERLAAVCYVKDCTLNAHRYKEYAERLDRLVQEARTNAAEAGTRQYGDRLGTCRVNKAQHLGQAGRLTS